ncbi:sulfotransferase [Fulvimonas yonginensis]|uniref:Sulfotransferase n=1 Tax=Fulvimonas yonginensis TaxID=1495200 RepID=A0ABU8JE97_9GAMM
MTVGTTDGATALLVLGMHRSGTSAVTRVLNLLGAHLGADLLMAQADNKRGFWEHAEAVAIHERLLTALGRTWHDTRELPHGWLDSAAAKTATSEIVSLIERDMKEKRLWAVKDPRMCRLAPIWIDALHKLGIDTKAVLVVREPYEVASSLHMRDGWSYAHAYLMWAEHLLDAYRATVSVPRALLTYDQLMDGWEQHLTRLGRELAVAWDPSIQEARPSIEAFLTPMERHHRTSELHVPIPPERLPPAFLQKLYEACARASQEAGWSGLEELSQVFYEVAGLFVGPMGELIRDRDKAAQARAAEEALALERLDIIHRLQPELEQSHRERSRFEVLAVERLERIQQLDDELAKCTKECSRFEVIAVERLERIQQLDVELADATEECSRFEVLAVERLERIQQLDAKLALYATERNKFEAIAAEQLERARQMESELSQSTKERNKYEVLAVERLERTRQLEAELAHAIRESARFEVLAVERAERIHQLEAEQAGILTSKQEAERLAGERLSHLQQVEADLAAHLEEVRQLRRQFDQLRAWAGSRWWLLKRAIRPVAS